MKRLACVSSLLLIAVAAHAQLRERTTVEVVEVPVYVSANGAPVTTLTRENFELFINGKRQAIDYFDVVDYATLSPEQSHDVRQRRLYMLVFDLLSPANALQRAQKAAMQFIEAAGVSDTFSVATLGRRGLSIVVPFSHDHLAVRRAIRNLDLPPNGDPLRLALTPTERGAEMGRPDRLRDPRFDDPYDPMVTITGFIRDEVANLTDLADRLAGMEGQRHVIFLSAGFDSEVLTGVRGPRIPGDVRVGPLASTLELNHPNSSVLFSYPNTFLLSEIEGLHRAYAAAGVFLDAIDIGGLRPFQSLWTNESLYAFTRETGGQVVDRRNDLTNAIQLLTDMHRVVYTLAFRAPNTGRPDNRIHVNLVNVPRGTHASYRPSYQSTTDQPDSGDMLRLADIITNDIPQNGVTTSVTAESAANGASVELSVPGRELLAHTGGDFIGAKAMLYIMSGESVVAFKIKRIDIDAARAGSALRDNPVRVRDTFELPPGLYAAKVLVRMDTTGALGFARADITVPPASP